MVVFTSRWPEAPGPSGYPSRLPADASRTMAASGPRPAVVVATSDFGSLNRLRSSKIHGLEVESWPKLGHVDPHVPYEARLASL
jgi:hypothetical protein